MTPTLPRGPPAKPPRTTRPSHTLLRRNLARRPASFDDLAPFGASPIWSSGGGGFADVHRGGDGVRGPLPSAGSRARAGTRRVRAPAVFAPTVYHRAVRNRNQNRNRNRRPWKTRRGGSRARCAPGIVRPEEVPRGRTRSRDRRRERRARGALGDFSRPSSDLSRALRTFPALRCAACANGTASPHPGATACSPCPRRAFSPVPARDRCDETRREHPASGRASGTDARRVPTGEERARERRDRVRAVRRGLEPKREWRRVRTLRRGLVRGGARVGDVRAVSRRAVRRRGGRRTPCALSSRNVAGRRGGGRHVAACRAPAARAGGRERRGAVRGVRAGNLRRGDPRRGRTTRGRRRRRRSVWAVRRRRGLERFFGALLRIILLLLPLLLLLPRRRRSWARLGALPRPRARSSPTAAPFARRRARPGRSRRRRRMVACVKCASGRFSRRRSAACLACPPASESDEGADRCRCLPGHAPGAVSAEASGATHAPPGRSSRHDGSSSSGTPPGGARRARRGRADRSVRCRRVLAGSRRRRLHPPRDANRRGAAACAAGTVARQGHHGDDRTPWGAWSVPTEPSRAPSEPRELVAVRAIVPAAPDEHERTACVSG